MPVPEHASDRPPVLPAHDPPSPARHSSALPSRPLLGASVAPCRAVLRVHLSTHRSFQGSRSVRSGRSTATATRVTAGALAPLQARAHLSARASANRHHRRMRCGPQGSRGRGGRRLSTVGRVACSENYLLLHINEPQPIDPGGGGGVIAEVTSTMTTGAPPHAVLGAQRERRLLRLEKRARARIFLFKAKLLARSVIGRDQGNHRAITAEKKRRSRPVPFEQCPSSANQWVCGLQKKCVAVRSRESNSG